MAAAYRIGVISDTHGYLHPDVFNYFDGVDLILHSGDVGGDRILTDLAAIAPVQAVSGNVDGAPHPTLRPTHREIETPAGRIGMTHGHLELAPTTNMRKMVRYFSDFKPEIIIYGHSHVARLDQIEGTMLFNPGAAGKPRFGSKSSVGIIARSEEGKVTFEHRHLKYPAEQSAGF